jgi:hypothetical protein
MRAGSLLSRSTSRHLTNSVDEGRRVIQPPQYQDLFAVPVGAGRTRAIRHFLAEMPAAAMADILGCRKRKPTRGASRFRQRDVARALRAAKATGGGYVEIDPVTGKLSVIPIKSDAQANVLDEWLAKRKTDADQA